jgi:hypothetical protein
MATLRVPVQPIINPIPYILHPSSRICGRTGSTMSLKAFPRYGRGETSAASKTFCTLRNAAATALPDFPCRQAPTTLRWASTQQEKEKKKRREKKYNQWMRRDVQSAWQTRGSYPAARTGPPPTATMLAIFFGSSTSLCWLPICTSCTKFNTQGSPKENTNNQSTPLYYRYSYTRINLSLPDKQLSF